MIRRLRLAIVWLVAVVLLSGAPARAQAPQAPAPLPEGISYPEFQGLGCILGGIIVATGAAAYVEVLTAGISPPVVVPVMAAGFVAGCGVGSIMAPGLWWIYRQF